MWRILKRNGLITPQPHKRPRSSFIRFEAKLPNETWQMDATPWQLADASPVELPLPHWPLAWGSSPRPSPERSLKEIIKSMTGNSLEHIVLPIFASTDAGPEIYRTIEDLEHYAEPIDVENGEWVGYDATGKQIAFLVDQDEVRVDLTAQSDPDRLEDWLRSSPFLKSRRDEDWLRRSKLPDLVAAYGAEDQAWREQLPQNRLRRWVRNLRAR